MAYSSSMVFSSIRSFSVVLFCILFSACGSSGGNATDSIGSRSVDNASSSESSKAADSVSSSSSSQVKLVTGVRKLEVNGLARTYILYVPLRLNTAGTVPLVIDFHGIFGDGAGQMASSGYKEVADSEGFLVVYPDGIDKAWNIGPCCTFNRDVDDVAFARAIVEQVKLEAPLDLTRIYAAGFSNGGGMAQYLGCHAADLFAAIAPSAFDLLEENSQTCTPSHPMPVLLTRGLADNFVTYSGGPSNPPNGLATTIHFLGAVATYSRWGELNHCTPTTLTDADGCNIHTVCDGRVQVGLCSIVGGVHSPGDASVGWRFLKQYQRL